MNRPEQLIAVNSLEHSGPKKCRGVSRPQDRREDAWKQNTDIQSSLLVHYLYLPTVFGKMASDAQYATGLSSVKFCCHPVNFWSRPGEIMHQGSSQGVASSLLMCDIALRLPERLMKHVSARKCISHAAL